MELRVGKMAAAAVYFRLCCEERTDDVGELIGHQMAADHLMVEMPLLEHFMVEEMAEGTVADIVQQAGDP